MKDSDVPNLEWIAFSPGFEHRIGFVRDELRHVVFICVCPVSSDAKNAAFVGPQSLVELAHLAADGMDVVNEIADNN